MLILHRARWRWRFHQPLQRFHIPEVVARFIDRGFSNESRMRKPRIVQQTAEGLQSNRALSNVLMPVEFGSACSFGVVAMPNAHILQPDGIIQLPKRVAKAVFRQDVVSGYMRVAGINAGADGHMTA